MWPRVGPRPFSPDPPAADLKGFPWLRNTITDHLSRCVRRDRLSGPPNSIYRLTWWAFIAWTNPVNPGFSTWRHR